MNNKITLLLIAALGLAVQGCAPSSYKVSEPVPSNVKFSDSKVMPPFKLNDERSENQKNFSYGVLKADLMLQGSKIDPIVFLNDHTVKELQARGVDLSKESVGAQQVNIKKLEMRNHRTNAYTPFITLTMLSADIDTSEGPKRIAAFIKRGKVPVWSFDEIVQPTLNEPLSLLVKEFSAKLNNHLYKSKMNDSDLQVLVKKVMNNDNKKYQKIKYLDIYQLGFSNNKKAIPTVYQLSKSDQEYIRMAAISSLGILGATEHFDYLKQLALTADTWTDKAMALKAIGDLDTNESKAFLTEMVEKLKSAKSKEKLWSSEIIGLYL